MTSLIQLYSFLFSFAYGIIFAVLNEVNNKLLINKPTALKYIITTIFIVNISLLYLILMYKINNGVLHIYFLMFVFLGYFISFKKIKESIKCIVSKIRLVLKTKQ